jgi:hypothetical protein
MNRRTQIASLVVLGILVSLLALGALPGMLKSGDPYFLTATAEGEWTGNDSAALADGRTAMNATELSEQRYPYAMAALTNATGDAPGRSHPYWKGPIGLKETFTHSPFDELDGIRQRVPTAAASDGVYVHDGTTVYRLSITEDADD